LPPSGRIFKLTTREVVQWKSEDGTAIEGILIKPADYDPSRKYPLLVVIHGGPTGVDTPLLARTVIIRWNCLPPRAPSF
jgi:dipeptidyl aminopeptidase/acylaminoacyl peptidase